MSRAKAHETLSTEDHCNLFVGPMPQIRGAFRIFLQCGQSKRLAERSLLRLIKNARRQGAPAFAQALNRDGTGQAGEILRVASRRIRSDLLPRLRAETFMFMREALHSRRWPIGRWRRKLRRAGTPPRWRGGRIIPRSAGQVGVFQRPEKG